MKYRCKNFMNNCPVSKVPIELGDIDDITKCPECGKDTLEEFVESEANYFLNKLKNPLVAGIIGGTSLIGGVGYYCFLGGGACFSDEVNIDNNKSSVAGAVYIKDIDENHIKIKKDNIINSNNNKISKKIISLPQPTDISIPLYSLNINTTPSYAKIIITNIKSKYRDGIILKKGHYNIKIIDPYRLCQTKSFSINLKNDTIIYKTLKCVVDTPTPTPTQKYSLTINSTPSRAIVKITNIKPKYHNGIRLKKGHYNIKIIDPIGVCNSKSFSINLKNNITTHKTLRCVVHTPTPTPIYTPPPTRYYSLHINTIPSNADVSYSSGSSFSNGSRLESGTYNFTVSRRGYYSKSVNINLQRDLSKTIYLSKIIQPSPIIHKSKCTKQLDKIEKYIKDKNSKKARNEISRFDIEFSCSASEEARRDSLEKQIH